MSELLKAWKNGKRGKFRRIDGGKLKFIRAHDGVVEKDVTSAAGMDAAMGSPAAEVHRTDTGKVCKCGQSLAKCSCVKKEDVEKHAVCDCTHAGLCKDAADCDCNCEDRASCEHRGQKHDIPSTTTSPEGLSKIDELISVLEAKLG